MDKYIYDDIEDWSDIPCASFADAFLSLGFDPEMPAVQLVQANAVAEALNAAPYAGGSLPLNPLRPVLIQHIYSVDLASRVKDALLRLYPDDLDVLLIGLDEQEPHKALRMTLAEIDEQERDEDAETILFLPAVDPLTHSRTSEGVQQIIARLRAPDGCPWDREQTHQSLTRYMIEEAYEAVQAIETAGPRELAEELGDVLLQILLHAQIAEEQGTFTLEDIFEILAAKMVRRHPHVFGDRNVETAGEVVTAWDQIKRQERSEQSDESDSSIFGSIPPSLPSLARAQAMLRRADSHDIDIQAISDRVATLISESSNVYEARLATQLSAVIHEAWTNGVDAEAAMRRWGELFEQIASESSAES